MSTERGSFWIIIDGNFIEPAIRTVRSQYSSIFADLRENAKNEDEKKLYSDALEMIGAQQWQQEAFLDHIIANARKLDEQGVLNKMDQPVVEVVSWEFSEEYDDSYEDDEEQPWLYYDDEDDQREKLFSFSNQEVNGVIQQVSIKKTGDFLAFDIEDSIKNQGIKFFALVADDPVYNDMCTDWINSGKKFLLVRNRKNSTMPGNIPFINVAYAIAEGIGLPEELW